MCFREDCVYLAWSTDWTSGRSSHSGTAQVLWSVMLPCLRKQEQSCGHTLVLGRGGGRGGARQCSSLTGGTLTSYGHISYVEWLTRDWSDGLRRSNIGSRRDHMGRHDDTTTCDIRVEGGGTCSSGCLEGHVFWGQRSAPGGWALPLQFGSIALLKEGVAVHSSEVELDKHAWGSEAMLFPASSRPRFKLAHWFRQLQRAGALSGELSPDENITRRRIRCGRTLSVPPFGLPLS